MGSVTYYSKKIGSIRIDTNDGRVTIETNRLVFKSLNNDNYEMLVNHYTDLLKDPVNVKLLNDGCVWDTERVKGLLQTKIAAWNSGECFGFFSGYDKKTMSFMGSFNTRLVLNEYEATGIGHKNVVEMGGILDKNFWSQGYGSESSIIIKKYIKHCILQKVENSETTLPGEFVATVHPENLYSLKILQKTLGNYEQEPLIKFGENPRLLFFKSIKLNNVRVAEPSEINSLLSLK